MASSFTGWSAHDIVGPLNKSEVRGCLLDFNLEKACFRTWDSIEQMIWTVSDDVKNVIYRCAMAKRNVKQQHRVSVLKRKREYQKMTRNVRRRLC